MSTQDLESLKLAEAEMQVEFEDHNDSISEEGRLILAHIAKMDREHLLQEMGSNGEPFNALKHWAEKDLGIVHTASEYLGYSIQSIVESKTG